MGRNNRDAAGPAVTVRPCPARRWMFPHATRARSRNPRPSTDMVRRGGRVSPHLCGAISLRKGRTGRFSRLAPLQHHLFAQMKGVSGGAALCCDTATAREHAVPLPKPAAGCERTLGLLRRRPTDCQMPYPDAASLPRNADAVLDTRCVPTGRTGRTGRTGVGSTDTMSD